MQVIGLMKRLCTCKIFARSHNVYGNVYDFLTWGDKVILSLFAYISKLQTLTVAHRESVYVCMCVH